MESQLTSAQRERVAACFGRLLNSWVKNKNITVFDLSSSSSEDALVSVSERESQWKSAMKRTLSSSAKQNPKLASLIVVCGGMDNTLSLLWDQFSLKLRHDDHHHSSSSKKKTIKQQKMDDSLDDDDENDGETKEKEECCLSLSWIQRAPLNKVLMKLNEQIEECVKRSTTSSSEIGSSAMDNSSDDEDETMVSSALSNGNNNNRLKLASELNSVLSPILPFIQRRFTMQRNRRLLPVTSSKDDSSLNSSDVKSLRKLHSNMAKILTYSMFAECENNPDSFEWRVWWNRLCLAVESIVETNSQSNSGLVSLLWLTQLRVLIQVHNDLVDPSQQGFRVWHCSLFSHVFRAMLAAKREEVSKVLKNRRLQKDSDINDKDVIPWNNTQMALAVWSLHEGINVLCLFAKLEKVRSMVNQMKQRRPRSMIRLNAGRTQRASSSVRIGEWESAKKKADVCEVGSLIDEFERTLRCKHMLLLLSSLSRKDDKDLEMPSFAELTDLFFQANPQCAIQEQSDSEADEPFMDVDHDSAMDDVSASDQDGDDSEGGFILSENDDEFAMQEEGDDDELFQIDEDIPINIS